MEHHTAMQTSVGKSPRSWLVTGAAGFIGSNLLLALLELDQRVVGLDNFSTGHRENLDEVRDLVTPDRWARFTFIEGDIRNPDTCKTVCKDVDYILHQAALGSVPRSLSNPVATNENNVGGFVNMLTAAKDAPVKRFVYASSSSVYGDHPALPKTEDRVGNCLSPYAASKKVNEEYAAVFARCYKMECIGLRYFNVFGPRQDPNGPYAAVIPKWIDSMIQDQPVHIYGDGETSRDFCYVANAVQANLRAALTENSQAANTVYNVAVGERSTLNQLYDRLTQKLSHKFPHLAQARPVYKEFRPGDIRHSHADITKAKELLGYNPTHRLHEGLAESLDWYITHAS